MNDKAATKKLQILVVLKGDDSQLNRVMTNVKKNINKTVGNAGTVSYGGGGPKGTAQDKMFQPGGSKDYILNSNQIRGATTGVRHEVGRLRNTLLLGAFALGGVVTAFKGFFEEVVKSENALRSLQSVAANTGRSFDRLKAIAVDLEKAGVMSIGGGSAAVKNLTAARLATSETVQVMEALIDAAAFNRQGMLSWEEAVIGATQGIKNMNCLAWNTPIYDPIRGETKTIEEWHDSGIIPCVLSLNRESGEMEVVQAQYLHYNGENEVYELEFENGKKHYATGNHPYLTPNGFKFVEDLASMYQPQVYYVDEEEVEKLLKESRNNILNDLWKQTTNINVESVQNLSLTMLLQEGLGVESNSVKSAGLKKSMKDTDYMVKSLVDGLQLNVKSVELISYLLKNVSKEDLDSFVQILAGRRIMDYNTLERIVAVFLVGLFSDVKNVEKKKNFLQEKFKEAVDSVLENVEETGGPNKTEEKQLQIGEEEKLLIDETEVEENINNGNNKYSSAIGYNVVNVMSFAQVIITRITYFLKPDSLNGNLNQIMVSPYVQDVIEKFTQEMTILLKNSLICSPMLLKIVKISLKPTTKTYDLSVPKNFNFVGDYIIVSNSIMIDNAGITKNVSVMYREYAQSIGTTAGKLTEVQKRQAIVNGIINEAAIFAGDRARAMNSYQGQLSKFNTTILQMKRGFGEVIAPDVLALVRQFSEAVSNITAESGFAHALKMIMNYFKAISSIMLNTVHMIENLFGGVMPFLLDNFISRLMIMTSLAVKTGTYFKNVADTFRKSAVGTAMSNNQNSILRQTMMKEEGMTSWNQLGFPKSKDYTLVTQRANVVSRIDKLIKEDKITSGKLNEYIQSSINNQLSAVKNNQVLLKKALNLKNLSNKLSKDISANEIYSKEYQTKLAKEIKTNIIKAFGLDKRGINNMMRQITIGDLGVNPTRLMDYIFKQYGISPDGKDLSKILNKIPKTQLPTSIGMELAKKQNALLLQEARLQGFNIIESKKGFKKELKIKLPEEGLAKGETIKQLAAPTQQMREQAGFLEKMKIDFALMGIQGGKSLKALSYGFKQLTANGLGFKALLGGLNASMLSFKIAGLAAFGAIKIAITSVLSILMTMFSWYLIGMTMYEVIMGWFKRIDEKKERFSQSRETYKIEMEALGKYQLTLAKTKFQVEALGKSIGENLYTSTGKNLNDTIKSMEEYNAKLKDALYILNLMHKAKAGIAEKEELKILSDRGLGYDIKDMEKQEELLNKLKEKEIEHRNAADDTINKIAELQEKNSQFYMAMAKDASSGYSQMFNAYQSYSEKLTDIAGDRTLLYNLKPTDLTPELKKQLDAQGKEYNLFNVKRLMIEKQYYIARQKALIDHGKAMADAEKRIMSERTKYLRASLTKELLDTKLSIEDQIRQVQQAIRDAEMQKLEFNFSIDTSGFELKKQIFENNAAIKLASNTLDELKNQLDEIEKSKVDLTLKGIENRLEQISKLSTTTSSGGMMADWSSVIEPEKAMLEGLKKKLEFTLKDIRALDLTPLEEIMETFMDVDKLKLIPSKNIDEMENKFNTILNVYSAFETELKVLKDPKNIVQWNMLDEGTQKNIDDFLGFLEKMRMKLGEVKTVITSTFSSQQKNIMLEELTKDLKNLEVQSGGMIDERIAKLNEEAQVIIKNMIPAYEQVVQKLVDTSEKEIELNNLKDRTLSVSNKFVQSTNSINDALFQGQLNTDLFINSLEKFIEYASKTDNWPIIEAKLKDAKLLEYLELAKQGVINFANIDVKIATGQAIHEFTNSVMAAEMNIKFLSEAISKKYFGEASSTYVDSMGKLRNSTELLNKAIQHQDVVWAEVMTNMIRLDFWEQQTEALNKYRIGLRDLQMELEGMRLENPANQSPIAMFLGLPNDLASTKNQYQTKIAEIRDLIRVEQEKLASYTKGQNFALIDFKSFNVTYDAIEVLNEQIEVLTEQQTEALKKIWFSYFSELINGFYNIGKSFGEIMFNTTDQLNREKMHDLEEQERLFKQGEISNLEHARRVADINKYYSDKVNYEWNKALANIGVTLLDTMQQVMTSIAAAQAATKAADLGTGLGAFISGLGAAIPGMAIAMGVGVLASALTSSPGLEPEFPTWENQGEDADVGKFGGSIKAEDLEINISPTFIFEGEQIFIGSGSIVEFTEEATELFKNSIQQAIENQEINLNHIKAAK